MRGSVKFLEGFLFVVFILGSVSIVKAQQQEEYVYYGSVPDKTWQVTLVDENDPSKGWNELNLTSSYYSTLVFLGYFNGTNVKVYEMGNETPQYEFELDSMDKTIIHLLNGTKFKVVTNHPIYVLLLSSPRSLNETEATLPNSFCYSIDGSNVGKKFMLVPTDWVSYDGYRIIALESAEVTIVGEDGTRKTLKLNPNEYRIPYFKAFTAYSVESTGYIMIQSGWVGSSSFYLMSVDGGFIGRNFYSVSSTSWDSIEENGFRIMAFEDTKVKVWDVEKKLVINEIEVSEDNDAIIRPRANFIMIEAEKPVIVAYIHDGTLKRSVGVAYGKGVTYTCARPHEETLFYLPTNSYSEAYIFSHENANVLIDGSPFNVKADSYMIWTITGTHRITSDKNIVIQIIHWPLEPYNQGALGWAVTVPCIQMVDRKINVTLTPIEEGFSNVLIIISSSFAIIILTYIVLRRRTKKGSSQIRLN